MFCVRNGQVHEIEIVKPSKRGTAFWCKINGNKKLKLISSNRMFLEKQEAINFIK